MTPFAPGSTIIVLPDTQYYCQDYPAIFEAQTDWIVANQAAMNIQAVLHVGDIVHRDNVIAQWDVASARMAALEAAGIPCGVAAGNHDLEWPVVSANFNAYFGPARYAALGPPAWYGGHRAGADDYWITWADGGRTWIAIFLAWDNPVEAAAVAWARGIMAANPNATCILVVHWLCNGGYPAGWGSVDISTNLWTPVSAEPNLNLLLCGHVTVANEGRRDETVAGRHVHVVFYNWQEIGSGGDGWLRILTVNDYGITGFRSYSPWLDRWQNEFESQFVVRI